MPPIAALNSTHSAGTAAAKHAITPLRPTSHSTPWPSSASEDQPTLSHTINATCRNVVVKRLDVSEFDSFYLNGNNKDDTKSPKDIVQTARPIGLSGCLLPSIVPQKRVVIDTSAGDVWFLHLASTFQDRLSCDEVIEGNKGIECVNLCFEFSIEYKCVDKISTMIQKAMTDYGSRTSIGVFDEKCFHEDLILVASQKANIIY